MLNNVMIAISGIAIVLILFGMYKKAKLQNVIVEEEDFSSIDKLVEAVKLEMVEIIKEDYSLNLSEAEFNTLYKRKARIQEALRNCVYGIDSAKVIVKELIRSYIADNVEDEKVTELLGLTEGQEPSDHAKFEILMYRFKKKYGRGALGEWVDKYGFANERHVPGTKRDKAYYITVDDLHMTYETEGIKLDLEEKREILATLVYQIYKGFGILDTLREMDINGFNIGTSGSILSNISQQKEGIQKADNAVWLYYHGKYIHLRFMNYGSQDELKRIIQLLIRYNNPGPLTAKRGYLVNTMYDKSRILALRPPASEFWAAFIRKFTLTDLSPEALIIKDYNHQGELAIRLIEYLMRGQVTCSVSGQQGAGKTTLMSSIIRFIDPRYTLRVLELAPELYLRELYPTRNILSVQETPTVTPSELQDALKKSDAAVSIVGEVATDAVAARMIQMGQVASLFTVFSHHAKTAKDLVAALRNSLVNAGGFSNMDTAAQQVMDVVKIDIHLNYTPDGKRYIERITEIIALEEQIPYPELNSEDIEGSMAEVTKEYYQRKTDRVSFWTQDILKYDLDTHTYHVNNRISPALESKIRLNLPLETRKEFDKFMFSEWGKRTNPKFKDEVDEIAEVMKKYDEEEEELRMKLKAEEKERLEKEEANKSVSEKVKEKKEVHIENVNEDVEELSQEDIEDAQFLFDFFDGEVDV